MSRDSQIKQDFFRSLIRFVSSLDEHVSTADENKAMTRVMIPPIKCQGIKSKLVPFIWMGWKLTGGRAVPAQSPRDVVKDKWQHVAVSFQSGKWWTVYLDGEVLIDYPKTGDKFVPIDAPLMVGMEEPPALNRYYNGDIDEFALFNRGLSQDEIKEIQDGIQDILTVDPESKLPTTWGRLKQRSGVRSKSN